MAVLGFIVGSVATGYAVPRLVEFGWSNAFTWFGRTAATWAAIAVAWELIVNAPEDQQFDGVDFGVTALLTLALRAVV